MLLQYVDNWDTILQVRYTKYKCNNDINLILVLERGIPVKEAFFGEGIGPLHFSQAACGSTDIRLTDCVPETETRICDHSEDAGVICIGRKHQ